MSVDMIEVGRPPSNRGTAGTTSSFLIEKRGWHLDRLAVRFRLEPGAAGSAECVEWLLRDQFGGVLPVDHRSSGRGRNHGLCGVFKCAWHLCGGKGSPGRVHVRHETEGTSDRCANSLRIEWNPAHSTAAVLGALVALVEALGGSWRGGEIMRFDAACDLKFPAHRLCIDDRLRKWRTIGAAKRETQYVGGGPLELVLYDKSTQMLEVHGIEVGGDVARFELRVRPYASVEVEDLSTGERLRAPEDRSLGGLGEWPYPAPRSRLRLVDSDLVDDVAMKGFTMAAEGWGVRTTLHRCKAFMNSRTRAKLVECWPVVDVESSWSDQWAAAVEQVVAAASVSDAAAAPVESEVPF